MSDNLLSKIIDRFSNYANCGEEYRKVFDALCEEVVYDILSSAGFTDECDITSYFRTGDGVPPEKDEYYQGIYIRVAFEDELPLDAEEISNCFYSLTDLRPHVTVSGVKSEFDPVQVKTPASS